MRQLPESKPAAAAERNLTVIKYDISMTHGQVDVVRQ